MIKCPHCNTELTREEATRIALQYIGSAKSEKKSRSSSQNGKLGGRPKGSKNKAPRSDKGIPRGPKSREQ